MKRTKENINPENLVWARETAGLSIKEVARKLGLRDSSRSTASEKLETIEREGWLSYNQLFKMAKLYHRPLTIFYLEKPPAEAKLATDFRGLKNPPSKRKEALLKALLRDIHARKNIVRMILEDDEDTHPLSFVGSIDTKKDPQETAQHIRDVLGINDPHELCRRNNSPEKMFKVLRTRVEDNGIFVVLAKIPSKDPEPRDLVFRGFTFADELASFIVINTEDDQAARSFTLIHELVHIFLNSTSISSTIESQERLPEVERFCNRVAGEFLLPETAIPAGEIHDEERIWEVIRRTAEDWRVSKGMVAYRFWQTGWITRETYRRVANLYTRKWQEDREEEQQKFREQKGGPNYSTVKGSQLGKALIHLVGQSLRNKAITYTEAAELLGMNPAGVAPFLSSREQG